MRQTGRRAGFTLLELLVATGVLVILGGALVVVLRGGVATWRRGEARRESFESAQAVLGQLADDLANATVDAQTSHGGRAVESIFLGDADDHGRSRLALVRTLRGESENAITGHAGSRIGGDARIDYRDDLRKAMEQRLRATGGLTEVAWCQGVPGTPTRDVLYRGIRSPVGGSKSFFVTERGVDHFFRAPLAGEPPPKVPPPEGVAFCRELARNVIHFELLYATPYANSWSLDDPPRKTTREKSGPLLYWDSTRGILAPPDRERSAKLYSTFLGAASRSDPADDVLPPRVKVTLVFREAPAADSSTFLKGDATAASSELAVTEPSRLEADGGFVLLDDEWVEYAGVAAGKARVKLRGARGTQPAAHRDGTEAFVGRTFEAVLPLPAAREDWGDR